MDGKNLRHESLRSVDVDNLRQILEHRFPPPAKARTPSSSRTSRASLLKKEETPWWWSPSSDLLPYGRESKVLDPNHLLSSEMLARSLALNAQQARDKLFPFVQSLAKQHGEDYDDMIAAWEGFGLDFMPRIPKQPGSPPDAMFFYKAKIEKDIQNIHLVLQYFAVLIEEVLHDQQRFNSPTKKKWEEIAEMLKQLLREVDVVLVTLELPRRRVPRSAIPDYARGLELPDAREARDWLAARDLLNAVELLWHVFSAFAAASDARREAQLRASSTTLARYGSAHSCGPPHPVSYCSLPPDRSSSVVILPYARLSPLPGRPVTAADVLYGGPRSRLSTPSPTSPAASLTQHVSFESPYVPHRAASRTSSRLDSPPYPPRSCYSFDLPHPGSPPYPSSPPLLGSPPSTASRLRHPRAVLPSSPPHSVSPPYPDHVPTPASDSSNPPCCKPPPRSQLPPFTSSLPRSFSLPRSGRLPTPASGSRTSAKHPRPSDSVPPCCLPPPQPELPPPDLSDSIFH